MATGSVSKHEWICDNSISKTSKISTKDGLNRYVDCSSLIPSDCVGAIKSVSVNVNNYCMYSWDSGNFRFRDNTGRTSIYTVTVTGEITIIKKSCINDQR